MATRTGLNERALVARLAAYANELLTAEPLEGLVGAEAEVTILGEPGDPNALYADIAFRSKDRFVSFMEVKRPFGDEGGLSPRDPELLDNALRKARRLSTFYFLTTNGDEIVLWQAPRGRTLLGVEDAVKTYWAGLGSLANLDAPDRVAGLRAALNEAIEDLDTRLFVGRDVLQRTPDRTFFIDRLQEAVERLSAGFQPALRKQLGDREFRDELVAWRRKQGLEDARVADILPVMSSQVALRLVMKIVFYHVVRVVFHDFLGDLPVSGRSADLEECFRRARDIDYEPVFGSSEEKERDLLDRIPLPEAITPALSDILWKLHSYRFKHIEPQIMGRIFEGLIPERDKRRWGQYYTNEDLIDLIEGFCIRGKRDKVLDPACGAGTFLQRAYRKLDYLYLSSIGEDRKIGRTNIHQAMLDQIWGFDVSAFAAELALINLVQQKTADFGSYPKVLTRDFFDVRTTSVFSFPPPNRKRWKSRAEVKVPAFDAVVGNPPYIAQEIVERSSPGFKQKVAECLADDWGNGVAAAYPGQADIYVAFFMHAAAFLREGGRLGFVSSNAWLNARYGRALQEFILERFRIVAVVESHTEPWFVYAQVTPVVTVLERCADEAERRKNSVRFVKLRKNLAEIITGEHSERFDVAEDAAREIEAVTDGFHEDANGRFDVRVVPQGELEKELGRTKATVKWEPYLRAPEVYHRLLAEHHDKFVRLDEIAEVDYGVKPGIVDFFVLDRGTIKHWGIEPEFCLPVVTTLRELERPVVRAADLDRRLFVCPLAKSRLRRRGLRGALKYIEHGEAQRTTPRGRVGTNGTPYPDVKSVSDREHWHVLTVGEPADIIVNQFMGQRYFFPVNRARALATNVFFQARFKDRGRAKLASALANSAFCYLAAEVTGRTQAIGHTNFYGPEIKGLLVPDPGRVSAGDAGRVLALFERLCARPFGSIHEERKAPDRIAFDAAVLHALGIPDPERAAKDVLGGLSVLAGEKAAFRDELPKKREDILREDLAALVASVIQGLVPGGAAKRFPGTFVPAGASLGRPVGLPDEGLHPVFVMMRCDLCDLQDRVVWSGPEAEGRYLWYAWRNGERTARPPADEADARAAVAAYEEYLRGVEARLEAEIRMEILDDGLAQAALDEVRRETGLPEVLEPEPHPRRRRARR